MMEALLVQGDRLEFDRHAVISYSDLARHRTGDSEPSEIALTQRMDCPISQPATEPPDACQRD